MKKSKAKTRIFRHKSYRESENKVLKGQIDTLTCLLDHRPSFYGIGYLKFKNFPFFLSRFCEIVEKTDFFQKNAQGTW